MRHNEINFNNTHKRVSCPAQHNEEQLRPEDLKDETEQDAGPA